MTDRPSPVGQRVLVVAPFARDAESIAALLERDGYGVVACDDLGGCAAALDDRTGAVLLTDEALVADHLPLAAALESQPPWSDIPFIVLTERRRSADHGIPATQRLPAVATNVITLERPLSGTSLISAVDSAMRSRQKQFEIRDRLEDLRITGDALAASRRRLDAIVNSIDQMIWSTRPDGFHDYFNQRWYDYTGTPHGSNDGDGWIDLSHPDDRERTRTVWQHSLDTGYPYRIEFRLRHRSGQYRWVLGRAQAEYDHEGRISRWYGTCTDIEEIVAAREVLHRSRGDLEAMVVQRTAELERAHEALRQSQKMEAVGQLTGGIAHDFNNMLTGVIGGIDLIRRRLASGRTEGIERFLDAASNSAQRAAALTARLLAFSRRQSLDSKPIDIATLIGSLHELLARTITEQVVLDIVAPPGLPPVVADANQLENALLNLAINARDAMPDGGRLVVDARVVDIGPDDPQGDDDVVPGRYVAIAVRDTGVGMPPEVIQRAYEPFFTTKPIGQGTGLGLSMVYGFARQSGGRLDIHSAEGEGTTVEILLPTGDAVVVERTDEPRLAPHGHGQTVLVVEDDDSVRLLVREVLDELGYHAIEVPEANAAMGALSSGVDIDLMISDVGLPGMNGRQLAEVARSHRPELPILFVTGYAENAAIRAGFLGTNMAMITKPFALDVLGRKIDEMLASAPARVADQRATTTPSE